MKSNGRLILAALILSSALPAKADKLSLRKIGDWFTNLVHPCHFPLERHPFNPARWVLTWSDEFNGSDGSACYTRPALCSYAAYMGIKHCPIETQKTLQHLNKCNWSVYHFKNYMSEALHDFSAEDVTVEGGNLVLTSRARPAGSVKPVGPDAEDCKTAQAWTANCALSAGGVESRPYGAEVPGFAQQTGRFEVRAKLPRTPGSWPAHWLMPSEGTAGWPADGEIDIMESFNGRTNRVATTLHWADNGQHQAAEIGCALNGKRDFADDFHVFAVEWEPGELRWFVDEYLVGRLRAKDKNHHKSRIQIPKHPFYWILNTSISTNGLDPARFPTAKHYIDYVRVYRPK